MKSFLTLLLVILIAQLGFSQIPTNGLVAQYLFSGDANDNSGNGNNGTVLGATLTADRCGNMNQAYEFDGVNDFIRVSDNVTLRPSKITISIWIKPATLNPNRILSKGNEANGGNGNYVIDAFFDNKIRFYIHRGQNCTPGDQYWASDTCDINWKIGSWSHLCCTYDGQFRKIYFDGQLKKTTAVSASIENCQSGELRFGKWTNGNELWFKGALDDIRIYNRAIDSTEVLALYNNRCTTGLSTIDFDENIRLSPNPTNELLYLAVIGNFNPNEYKLRNLLGELILHGQITSKTETIDVSKFTSGLYILEVKGTEGRTSRQFIKM